MGGTKIEGILMSEKGKILKKVRKPTEAKKSKKIILNNIVEVISKLCKKKIIGIGIGHPGFSINNKLTSIFNIKTLIGINLQKEIQKRTKIKTFTENDANCFALAEHTFGAAKNSINSIGLIIGTGIGAGFMINNKLYKGSHNGAGEVGYEPMHNSSFEKLCSGANLVRRYNGKIKNAAEILTSKDPKAKKIIKDANEHFAQGFATMINYLDPDVIVIGGGMSKSFNAFIPKVKKLLPKYAPNANQKYVKIVKNKLGDSSGVIGAALLPFKV